jgi:hypothetical protein
VGSRTSSTGRRSPAAGSAAPTARTGPTSGARSRGCGASCTWRTTR